MGRQQYFSRPPVDEISGGTRGGGRRLYGVAVYFFMQWVVLPLSKATRRPFSWEMMWIAVAIHMLCVGLPIALSVRRFAR
jgi:hypothetical protein